MFSTDFTLTQGDILEVKGQSDRIRLLFPQVSIKFENLWVTIDGATQDNCYKCKVRIVFLLLEFLLVNFYIFYFIFLKMH